VDQNLFYKAQEKEVKKTTMNYSKYISDFYDTEPTFETLVNKEMVIVQNPTGGYFNHVELQASAANDGNVQVKLCGLANENWSCGLGGNWSETVPNWKDKISTGINLKYMPSDISESLENVHKHMQVVLKDGLTMWNEHHAKTNKTKRLEPVRSGLEASMVISPHMTDGASKSLEPYLAKRKLTQTSFLQTLNLTLSCLSRMCNLNFDQSSLMHAKPHCSSFRILKSALRTFNLLSPVISWR
jgi:hypothetical protein